MRGLHTGQNAPRTRGEGGADNSPEKQIPHFVRNGMGRTHTPGCPAVPAGAGREPPLHLEEKG